MDDDFDGSDADESSDEDESGDEVLFYYNNILIRYIDWLVFNILTFNNCSLLSSFYIYILHIIIILRITMLTCLMVYMH